MCDSYDRRVNYLRLSVTDRCNLCCRYCMPQGGVRILREEELLSCDRIVSVARTAVTEFAFDKIRLTGGEPLVRADIVELAAAIGAIKGVKDFGLTTNGILLAEYAKPLKQAGVMRINVSLDALDSERYRYITRGGDVKRVIEGIDSALNAGFAQIKLNCVVKADRHEPDARAVAAFAHSRSIEVRFIQEMDLRRGHFARVYGGSGGDCAVCNRLRMSSDGNIYPCLFNDMHFSIAQMGEHEAIAAAIRSKPRRGEFSVYNSFYRLGG